MTDKLKSCPFCGGNADLEPLDDNKSTPLRWSCGCFDEDCMGYQSFSSWPTQKQAIKAWNTRPIYEPEQDLIEKMAESMWNARGYIFCPTWKELLERWGEKPVKDNCWTPKIEQYRKRAKVALSAIPKARVDNAKLVKEIEYYLKSFDRSDQSLAWDIIMKCQQAFTEGK